MKHIPLKTLLDAESEPVDYARVLREVLHRPLDPQAGVTIAEMRQSLRVLDALDAANGTLELEDADFEHLRAKLEAMPWRRVDRRIMTLIEDVAGAS